MKFSGNMSPLDLIKTGMWSPLTYHQAKAIYDATVDPAEWDQNFPGYINGLPDVYPVAACALYTDSWAILFASSAKLIILLYIEAGDHEDEDEQEPMTYMSSPELTQWEPLD